MIALENPELLPREIKNILKLCYDQSKSRIV